MDDDYTTPTIKQPTFDFSRFEQPKTTARNAKEALIEDIAASCACRSDKERSSLKRRIAIWMNTTKADETDLHALYQKRNDPSIRNFGAFVSWTIKIRKAG